LITTFQATRWAATFGTPRLLAMRFCPISVLLPVLALQSAASAQSPFCIGKVLTLQSSVLGEERTINVALPPGYQDGDTTRYPVIFLLDGSANEDFIHVAGALQFATMDWIAWQRPSILVGIANVDRKRDFTYPTTIAKDKEQFPSTGGSAAFIEFLAKELIPFVDVHFHTGADRMLIGQSLGGLLAAEILVKKPALFNRYLIASPSLWWDDGSLLKQPAAPGKSPEQVFIAVGKEGHRMVADARKLRSWARQHRTAKVGFEHLRNFDHANILHRAVMDGFRWMGGK
jgi:predicted alpha/beta superfamily hydrolase